MLKNFILMALGALIAIVLFKPLLTAILIAISVACYVYRDDLKDVIMFLKTKRIKG